ncbi:MAG: BAX inhibitor (BI)-1/YccA family protein [Calditrichaeota bacterium]|nr:MAG: BAX inhibitor (BI)-1/YccA family protein [Calditrichota bacterium]
MFDQTQSFARIESNEQTAAFFRRVYAWMSIGLFLTGIISMAVASSESLVSMIFGTPLFWVLFLGQLGLVFWLSSRVQNMSPQVATAAFLGYAALNGLTLSVIFLAYTMSSIAQVFFITGGTFGFMTLWGMTTKKDLSSLGQIAFAALIGLIIASVVNMFFQNSMIYWITSYAGVLIFMALTAWDTQKLKQISYEVDVNTAAGHNVAIIGALTLYLDFINLFIFLLRIFGGNKD